jgi:hypothetical protein
MPPLVIPNTVQVVAQGSMQGGETWANVWHCINQTAGSVTQANADSIGGAFRSFYFDTRGYRDTAWSFVNLTVRSLNQAGENVYTADILGLAGSAAAQGVPYECAVAITLRTAINTRRGRGRSFQNGFAVTALGTNAAGATVVAPLAVDNLALNAGELLRDLDLMNFPLAVASRADNFSRRVTGGYVDDGWDTIRGRSNDILTTRTVFNTAI